MKRYIPPVFLGLGLVLLYAGLRTAGLAILPAALIAFAANFLFMFVAVALDEQ